eukprot:CAMPEP_0174288848 /NCGR_PEP_ID=MMETSP0809-20121228/22482_1 /TAXON_ID=73025 ORGANISM="Eutreptiella gymnastica-like, Strain CCMP1594" /NCGR_SAMPLE_ID=MMETSP0809 /ASSEMBLY_ACC=CAM_ASM_000658 /LENGTH=332 /DNA_ID=CAMNT_0015386361 /DNA_START=32 /DNA_END=1027 /DNA_ORIENTATION=-
MESNRHSAALSTSAVDDQNLIKGVERLTVDNTPETADAEFERVTPPMSGAAGTKPIRAKAPSGLPTNPVTWHGHLMQPDWDPPILVASSQEEARPGYISCIASEYFDTKATLARKVKVLAHLIRKSKQCCVYTGAGISTTTGVGDYASKAKGSKAPHLAGNGSAGGNRLSAAPAQSHHCLAALERKGHVKHWLQQNHDRLAQKAGFPQAKLNEIHGAWGDDKNPVLMMDDKLRPDMIRWMQQWESQADLCLAMGTSLCGMTADVVAEGVAHRFMQGEAGLLGLCIINLQQTPYDDRCALRIWGLLDDVLKLLAKELKVKVPNPECQRLGNQW